MLSVYETLNVSKYVRQNGVFNYRPLLQVCLSILILKKMNINHRLVPQNMINIGCIQNKIMRKA